MPPKLVLLKSICKEKNYSYARLGKLLGFSKVYVWQLINGKRRLYYTNAILLAKIFNMTPDEMFYANFVDDSSIKKKIKDMKLKEMEK